MSFINGLVRSVVNPATIAQLAMGPGGWAALAARTIGTAIAQEVIKSVGQQLGLPPAAISLAQNAFAAASGTEGFPRSLRDAVSQVAQQGGFSPQQQGALLRDSFDGAQWLAKSVLDKMVNGDNGEGGGVRGGRRRGESFLMALARVMGQAIDGKMDKLMSTAKSLDQANQSGDKSHVSEMSAKIQALSQEVSMLSNALNNSIKSLGEASTTLARKN